MGPFHATSLSLRPRILSARRNRSAATGNCSAKSRPIPTTCAPCPANKSAIFVVIREVLPRLVSPREWILGSALPARLCAGVGAMIKLEKFVLAGGQNQHARRVHPVTFALARSGRSEERRV